MKPIVITDVTDEENVVPFALPGGKTVNLPRLDFIDEDTFDALNTDLEALDVKQQLIAVANDVVAVGVGKKSTWQPLLPGTKAKLLELGVEVSRSVDSDERRDEVCAPTVEVLEALKPFSGSKPLPLRKRGREIALTMLKHVVDDDDYKLFESLRVGQLDRILTEWRKHSAVTLGE